MRRRIVRGPRSLLAGSLVAMGVLGMAAMMGALALSPARAMAARQVVRAPDVLLAEVHHFSRMEVEYAQLALLRSPTLTVRAFAARVVEDHQPTDEMIDDEARLRGVDFAQPPPVDEGQKLRMRFEMADLERLARTGPDAFDEELLSRLQTFHERAIPRLWALADGASDARLSHVTQELATVLAQHHRNGNALLRASY